jgi:hypothetical protein
MFRYEPSLEADVDVAPADPQDSQPATWAWTCELVTRYGRSGATCRVTYRLQTTGQRQVEVRLPPRAQLQQLLVDGREVRTSAAGESPHVDVLLPADVRYPTLEVVYRDPGAVLPWGAGEVRPATPNLAGVPVLCQSWTVWLPPDYRVSPVRPPTHALNADSLGERLFGPLWRGAGHPFQLFSEQDWAALAESSGEQRALQSGEDCLAALGRIHLELAETTAQDPSWSQLLSAYQALASANESGAAPPLYVDSAALAAAAVSPQTLAPKLNDAAAAEPPGDVGAELLQAANLILLAGPERIVLTTRRGSLPAATRLTPTNRGVWVMEPASMQATQGNPTEQPTSLELWLSGSAASGAPWHVGSNQSFAGLEDAGWNVYRFDLDPQQAPECTVMQPALFGMLGWSLLLMSAALVFALAARRPAWLVLLVGAAACAACLAAEPYTPLATGALLGALLACGFVAALAPRRRSHAVVAEAARHSGDTTRSMRVAGALLLAVWGGTIAGSSLAAEPPAPHGLTPAPVLYPVIIPVDQDRRPSLGYVWIPPEFDDALREREKLVAGPPHPVRLLRSEYECRLEWQGETLKAESLAAVIEFSVGGEITKPTQISIPLAREGLDLTDAQLAGQRANIEFDKPQDRLLITVDRAGDYLLELRFRPQNHLAGRHTSISARVPRVARSRLRIQVPPGASGVETPSALGSSVFDESSGELVADLGPADRLHVTWPTSGGLEPKRSDLAVEELLWLKVQRPGSVVVDARFRFRREGLIDHVRLTADRRLRPLPAGAESPISEIHDEQHSPDAELKTFHIAVDPPVENEAVLQFSFLLTDASGVGSLRLPHLQAVADRTTSRRMAVNVHPPLEFEQTGQLAALPVDAFVREWGASATESPDLAFDLPKDATPAWSLSTRPKSPRTVVEQATTLVELGRGEAFVDFTADLLTQDGSVFQHRLILPAELNVESVSVKGQEDTAARWSRSADGTLTVLLNRRVTGPQQFSLQARSALENGRFALPQIEFVDAPSASNEYYVQRSPDVQVECNPSDELELVAEVAAELAGRYARSGLRFVAGFRRTSSDPLLACVFEVSPNQPQTSCRSILALRRAGGRWNVENTLRLNVKDGQLDELWLDVSERLAEPLQLEPPADYEVQTVPGQKTRRRVVIRPEQPIRGNATIVLRAALSTQGGEPVNGAEVVPLEMNELELFIVVPRQAEAQSFVWQPRGVQGASLPEGEPMPEVGDEAAVWRAGTPPFSLTLKQSEPLASVPAQVHLADIHFAWGEAGDCRGLAVFDLEPAGLTSCVLVLPPECRLVHASVAGLPATIASQGDHHWRLLLGPAQLPQRIAVVSEGRLPPSGSARSIPAPSLEGISVERTLWTLYPPAGRAVRTDDADTLENHLLRRYESITRLLDRGANVAVEQSSQDVERWYLPWSRRLVALHRVIARSSGNGDSALSELQSMDEVEQRLKVRPAGTAAVEEREIWNLTMPDTESPVRCTLTGSGGGMLDVQESVPANSDWGVRVVACILIGAASLLVFLLALRGPLGDWLHRWPHAVGVLVGLAWWLWLTPSLLGWGIVLLSVISAIRSPWKVQRRTPALVPLSNVSRRASSSS